MSIGMMVGIWIGLSLLAAIVATMKNRSAAAWLGVSILISPVLALLILIFMSSLEKYEYSGEPSLRNDAYKIYLTKQYKIEKIDTLNKFQCEGKTFNNSYEVLRFAQSRDRGMDLKFLETEDSLAHEENQDISDNSNNKQSQNNIHIPPVEISKVNENIISSGIVVQKSKSSRLLIAVIAVAGIFAIFYAAEKYRDQNIDLKFLESQKEAENLTVDGELAKAFNLNSKFTDIQRENLLTQIKGKVVVWVVEVYEVEKKNNKKYKIQTRSGLSSSNDDVGTYIDLYIQNDEQSKFIEELKTGERIRIKGVLTGESILRSLVISPAILWYPEEKETQSNADTQSDKSNENDETCYEKWYAEAREMAIADQQRNGNNGPYVESELVPLNIRMIAKQECNIKAKN